jgi:HEAT repeat protein
MSTTTQRIAGGDFDGWVDRLRIPSQRKRALLHLQRCGAPVVPALRRGLVHDDPQVRATCAQILDRLLDDDAVPDLVAALDDPDPMVVKRALHSLACDRCKEGACRPADDLFVAKALELARTDPRPAVRAGAFDALAQASTRDPDLAARALAIVDGERDPGLRHAARLRFRRGHGA